MPVSSKQETALPKKSSPAASRILRAVEKARSEGAPAVEAAAPIQAEPVEPMPEAPAFHPPVDSAPSLQKAVFQVPAQNSPTAIEDEPAAVAAPPQQVTPVPPAAPRAVRKVEEPIVPKLDAEAGLRSLDAAQQQPKTVAEVPATPKTEPKPKPEPKTEPKAGKKAEPPVAAAPAPAAAPAKKSAGLGHDKSKKSIDIAAAEPEAPAKAAPFEAPVLGSGPTPKGGVPLIAKVLAAALALGGGGYYLVTQAPAKSAAVAKAAPKSKANRIFVPMSGVGGWSANWSGDPAKTGGRTISMFRPSLQQADYRIEFEGQIEAKGFGWVFRAKDTQNYYGYRVEVVKPGLQPLVALARIAVFEGNESQKHYALLDKPMRPDTVYRVRMDANGSEFTTWINDQLIEVWQDDRLAAGGIGLFTEKEDRSSVRKVQILEMR